MQPKTAVKQKPREDNGPLLDQAGEKVTDNAGKTEVLSTFFPPWSAEWPELDRSLQDQAAITTDIDLPVVPCKVLNPHKCKAQEGMYPRVSAEVADIIAGPLSYHF